MRLARLLIPLFFAGSASALECKPPAQLKQAEASGQTLLSWCEENGVKNGAFEQFSVNGGLQLRANYVDGKLDGPFKRFWPDGKTAAEGEFKNGQMSGKWTRFSESGSVRDIVEWSDDKPVVAPVVRKPFRTSDNWRLRIGIAHSDDNVGDHAVTKPGFGADLHLFELGRWLRTELSARILPEYFQEKEKSVYSGQIALAVEPLAGFLDPFALTAAIGPHWTGFDKSKGTLTLGLRYQWHEKRSGFSVYGAFFELTGFIDNHDNNNGCNNNNCGNMGNQPSNGPDNYHHDTTIAHAGIIFSL